VPRFSINPDYEADCQIAEGTRIGEIYHVVRNVAGGSWNTPIANFFAWRPEFIEGYNAYWRVDCFVRDHALAPPPGEIGEALAHALMREKLCDKPLWVSWHQSRELGGKEFGEVFEREE
jgi:hypothetical protein